MPKKRKAEKRQTQKPLQPNISRRRFLATIFNPLNRIPNIDKKIWKTRLTRRQLVKGTVIGGTGLLVAHKLGLTTKAARAIPVWLRIHKPFEVEFGFTSHDFVGTNGFAKLMNEAASQGKPFNWVFFESAYTDNETRLSLEAEINRDLGRIKKEFETNVKILGRKKAELKAKSQIRSNVRQGKRDLTEIYFAAMLHGTKVKILEFQDKETLKRLEEMQVRQKSLEEEIGRFDSENKVFDNLPKVKEVIKIIVQRASLRNKAIPRNLKQLLGELPSPYLHGRQRILVYFGRGHRDELIEMMKSEKFFEGEKIASSEKVSGEIEEKYRRTSELTDLDAAKHFVAVLLENGIENLFSLGDPEAIEQARYINSKIRSLSMEKIRILNEELKGKTGQEIIDTTLRVIVN